MVFLFPQIIAGLGSSNKFGLARCVHVPLKLSGQSRKNCILKKFKTVFALVSHMGRRHLHALLHKGTWGSHKCSYFFIGQLSKSPAQHLKTVISPHDLKKSLTSGDTNPRRIMPTIGRNKYIEVEGNWLIT